MPQCQLEVDARKPGHVFEVRSLGYSHQVRDGSDVAGFHVPMVGYLMNVQRGKGERRWATHAVRWGTSRNVLAM